MAGKRGIFNFIKSTLVALCVAFVSTSALGAVCSRIYTVTLDANRGTDGSLTTMRTANARCTTPAPGLYYPNGASASGTNVLSNGYTLPTNIGNTFNGFWSARSGGTQYIDANGNVLQDFVTAATAATAAFTVYAQWTTGGSTASTTTVSFNTNGAGYIITDTVTATYGQPMPTLNITAPTRTGYTFGGWYDTDASTGGTQYYTAAGASARNWDKTAATATLYARWTAKTYTIYFEPNGGSGGQSTNVTATYGQPMPAISTTAPKRTGYTFGGWYDTDASTGGTKYYNADGSSARNWDKTGTNVMYILYARWTSGTNTVSFNANGGSGGQTADVTATYGQPMPSISTTAPTRTGYTFGGWYDTDASTGGTQYYTAAGASARTWNKTTNTTLYARWSSYFVVTLDANGGTNGSLTYLHAVPSNGEITPGIYYDAPAGYEAWSQNVVEDDGYTLPSRTGYNFAGFWSTQTGGTLYISSDGTIQEALDDAAYDSTGPFSIYAHWTAKSIPCSAGQYLRASDATCQSCPAGYYCPSTSVTYTYNGNNQGLTVCGAGKFSTGGATSCSNINTTFYCTGGCTSSTPGGGEHVHCLSGYSCGQCPSGYREIAAASLNDCRGTFTKTGSQLDPDIGPDWCTRELSDCTPGTCNYTKNYAGTIISDCTPTNCTKDQTATACASGSYLVNGGCLSCSGLGGGLYSNSANCNSSGSSACYASVPADKRLNATTDTSFTSCPTGYSHTAHTLYYNNTSTACSGNTYTVSFNANGGSGGQSTSVTAIYGSAMPYIIANAPTRTGYTFGGWYDTDASTGGTQYYTAAGASARTWNKTSNATLYARWTANTITIIWTDVETPGTGTTFTAVSGQANTYKSTVTYDGDIITPLEAVHKVGQTFLGWYFVSSD